MKKYVVVRWMEYINKPMCIGSFDERDEAIAFACLSRKNESDHDIGIYCLSASIKKGKEIEK